MKVPKRAQEPEGTRKCLFKSCAKWLPKWLPKWLRSGHWKAM